MENMSRHRELAEIEDTDDTQNVEESQIRCYFTHYSQTHSAFKAKKKDQRIPRSFEEARKDKNWRVAIDREYNALVNRNTWTYVPRTNEMRPLPFLWNFRVKDTSGYAADVM